MENVKKPLKTRKTMLVVSCVLFVISVLILLLYLVTTGVSVITILEGNGTSALTGTKLFVYFFVIAVIGLPVTVAAFICSLITISSYKIGIKITAAILSVLTFAQIIIYVFVILNLFKVI
jgi:hypothetical protein